MASVTHSKPQVTQAPRNRFDRLLFRKCGLFLLLLLLIPSTTFAKRGPRPIVPPVQVGELELRVPNDLENRGFIEAWNTKSNTLMWTRKLYWYPVIPIVETDAQWVFIKSMKLSTSGKYLEVTDERGAKYEVDVTGRLSWSDWRILSGLFGILLVGVLIYIARKRQL